MLGDAGHTGIRRATLRGAVEMAGKGKRHQCKGDEDKNPHALQNTVS